MADRSLRRRREAVSVAATKSAQASVGANVSEEVFKIAPEFPSDRVASPEERPAGLVEIAGSVKWFDVSKGYGFIVADGGEGDVLIHVTVLRRDGFQTIFEGSRVVAEAQRREKGLQVFRVLSVTPGEGEHLSQLPPARLRARPGRCRRAHAHRRAHRSAGGARVRRRPCPKRFRPWSNWRRYTSSGSAGSA